MPTLTIDNQTVTVPDGTNVLEAAKRLGIVIPHFCYHEALGAVGACRLCAMTFEDGPVKGLQMACLIEAKEGMVVSTEDKKAADLRAHVIEWLMMHHPHDCPVCDEGGECQLQDMTVAGGHGIRRYRGKKRTYDNQDLGPFIEHEMNRCIQCYRCVRTYQDYFGGSDFGALGCNQRIYFGRFRDGRLESPFSGNLVDVCPTGVFTDKTFRYRTRYWDIEEAPSICPHCSLGCAVIPGARYRELQRVRSGVNRKVNGFFICDRGRFGYGHANHPARPRRPRIDGRDADWPEALKYLRDRIASMVKEHGPNSIALLGSPRASLEANFLLRRWASELGCAQVIFDCHPERDRTARTVAGELGDKTRSLEEIARADAVLLIGADPLAEGPMLAAALRQAVRRGAFVAALDPRPVELPCAAAHLPLPPERLPDVLDGLANGDFAHFSRQEQLVLEGIARRLREAGRPVLIGGGDFLESTGTEKLLRAAAILTKVDRPCGVMVLLEGPNSFAGGLLATSLIDFDSILDAVRDGTIKTLVCLEADPLTDFPDPGQAQELLAGIDFLAVIDGLPTLAAERADLFLPTTVTAEGSGTFINNEGRMQAFAEVFAPGLPIRVTGEGDHPPRTFSSDTPGDLPRPAWGILADLQDLPRSLHDLRSLIENEEPRFAGLASLEPGRRGQRVAPPSEKAPSLPPAAAEVPHREPEGTLRLVPVTARFGSDLPGSLSAPWAAVRPKPTVLLNRSDAERLDLMDGDRALLTTSRGHLRLTVAVTDQSAPGLAILPRLRGTPLDDFIPGSGHLDCTLTKDGTA